ncbi:HD domain-containing protein [Candidatus Azambacteria bacterium]|nr:HD domain-containing protein [Candidatus Azambacteria bacterium]
MVAIPAQVSVVLRALRARGYEAYAVGGCVRDALLGRVAKDWDAATNAKPEEIQKVFPKSFYENKFGTVTVIADDMEIQVTTYRVDAAYSDKRHPDDVRYTADLKEDLARRDFTMNAMAVSEQGEIVDPFDGQKDIKEKIIRAVGDAEARFNEDALRILRAIRFAAQLHFRIEEKTYAAIRKFSSLLKFVSKERIRDELVKMIESDGAANGIELMRDAGLLELVLPELAEGIGVGQNKHHIYTVYEHNLRAFKYAVEQKWNFHVRIASLLHDVGKPRTKVGDGIDSTFYNHDLVGSRMARQIMTRLKFPTADTEKVALLVRWHLFYYNVDEVTASSVRRLIRNVGLKNMDDLINLRIADRIGSGVPKAEPYKLRHFRYMVESVSKDPISSKMLKINGNEVMRILEIQPGPKVGIILSAPLGEVLDDPKRNTEEYLSARTKEFDKFSTSELGEIIKKGEEKIELIEMEERRKHRV